MGYKLLVKLCCFILDKVFENRDYWLIFVGLSFMGSMGFLDKLGFILEVFEVVLEVINSFVILFIVGYFYFDFVVIE